MDQRPTIERIRVRPVVGDDSRIAEGPWLRSVPDHRANKKGSLPRKPTLSTVISGYRYILGRLYGQHFAKSID